MLQRGVARPWTEQIHCKGCKRTKSRKEGQPIGQGNGAKTGNRGSGYFLYDSSAHYEYYL